MGKIDADNGLAGAALELMLRQPAVPASAGVDMPNSGRPTVEEDLKVAIGEWIVAHTLAGANELEILAGICEQLNRAGLSIMRASVAHDLLDPTFDARGVRWLREQGALEEAFPRSDDPLADQEWMRSPFFRLLESHEALLRRSLDATYQRGEFPMLDRFQDEGATDYAAIASRVGGSVRLGEGEGVAASWTTDVPGGFSAAHIRLLTGIMPPLTLVFMLRTMNRTARTLIRTYLGSDAADRVLAGNIVRGRAEPIRAAVSFSDLVGFTRISEKASAGTVLELLNDYAEAQVEEIEAHGGHVLKFIGDGILAIFPQEDMAQACRCALDAAAKLRERLAALSVRRAAHGMPVTTAHIALHVGELLYGNLGSPRRLDFTVLGPAVNEAARIESFCASLEQAVIVSTPFAEASGHARRRLVSVGRYAMNAFAETRVTRHSGDIGNTPAFAGSAKCLGRSVPRWMSVSDSSPDCSTARRWLWSAESSTSRARPATRSSSATRTAASTA